MKKNEEINMNEVEETEKSEDTENTEEEKHEKSEENANSAEIKIEDKDLSTFKIQSIVGAMPLEPCVALASVDSDDKSTPYKIIGIPGFFDIKNDKFLLLNGSPVQIEGFQEKWSEFVAIKRKQNQTQEEPNMGEK